MSRALRGESALKRKPAVFGQADDLSICRSWSFKELSCLSAFALLPMPMIPSKVTTMKAKPVPLLLVRRIAILLSSITANLQMRRPSISLRSSDARDCENAVTRHRGHIREHR